MIGSRTKILFLAVFLLAFFYLPQSTEAAVVMKDGVLVKSTGPEVYFIENGMIRWIEDPEAFSHLNFDWSKIRFPGPGRSSCSFRCRPTWWIFPALPSGPIST